MNPVNLIRISVSIVIATICLCATGCGEHAEPLEGPAALSLAEGGQ